jgi:hypothetical protein
MLEVTPQAASRQRGAEAHDSSVNNRKVVMAKKPGGKFAKFGTQEVVKKERYATGGSVTRGYTVIDTQTGDVILKSEYLWDVLDRQRKLNTK